MHFRCLNLLTTQLYKDNIVFKHREMSERCGETEKLEGWQKKKHSHTNAAENQILPLLAHSDYITKNGHVRKRYDGKYWQPDKVSYCWNPVDNIKICPPRGELIHMDRKNTNYIRHYVTP